MDRDWCTALVQFSFQVLRWKCIRTPRNQANWLSFIFLNWEGGIIMDFRRMTSILSCSNLEEGFTNRIIVMLMDSWKIDLFWHKFYLNLSMYEISTSNDQQYVLFSRMNCFVYCCQLYGRLQSMDCFKVCICRCGRSRVFLPSSLQSYNGIFYIRWVIRNTDGTT